METPPSDFPAEPVRLEGQGLVLREWGESDLPDLAELYDDPEISRWTPVASPFDEAAARAYVASAREARCACRRMQWAVTTDGGEPLGEVLLFRAGPDDRDIEIAYGIGSRFRRRGLAGRALGLATHYASGRLRARRVLLRIEADNLASTAVARSAGFRLTGDALLVREVKGRRAALQTWCHRPSR